MKNYDIHAFIVKRQALTVQFQCLSTCDGLCHGVVCKWDDPCEHVHTFTPDHTDTIPEQSINIDQKKQTIWCVSKRHLVPIDTCVWSLVWQEQFSVGWAMATEPCFIYPTVITLLSGPHGIAPVCVSELWSHMWRWPSMSLTNSSPLQTVADPHAGG